MLLSMHTLTIERKWQQCIKPTLWSLLMVCSWSLAARLQRSTLEFNIMKSLWTTVVCSLLQNLSNLMLWYVYSLLWLNWHSFSPRWCLMWFCYSTKAKYNTCCLYDLGYATCYIPTILYWSFVDYLNTKWTMLCKCDIKACWLVMSPSSHFPLFSLFYMFFFPE